MPLKNNKQTPLIKYFMPNKIPSSKQNSYKESCLSRTTEHLIPASGNCPTPPLIPAKQNTAIILPQTHRTVRKEHIYPSLKRTVELGVVIVLPTTAALCPQNNSRPPCTMRVGRGRWCLPARCCCWAPPSSPSDDLSTTHISPFFTSCLLYGSPGPYVTLYPLRRHD